jgi:hypothetical protein
MTIKHGAPWSPAEMGELRSLAGQQLDRRVVAAKLGRTEEAIAAKLYKLSGRRTTHATEKRQQRRLNGASFFLS